MLIKFKIRRIEELHIWDTKSWRNTWCGGRGTWPRLNQCVL